MHHPASKTTNVHNGNPTNDCEGRARRNGFASHPCVKRSYEEILSGQLGSAKIPKTALFCLLFHRFPYSRAICGSDSLCYTPCANVHRTPKTLPCSVVSTGPPHPVHISHRRPTISAASRLAACAITLMRVVARRQQRLRVQMSHHVECYAFKPP